MDLKTLTSETQRCLIGWRVYEKDLIKAGLEGPLRTIAVGWKVADHKELSEATHDLLPLCDQVHIGTVDNRFIGTYVLKEKLNADDIRIIKILQLRPGSKDPLGLDHLDFYVKGLEAAKKVLTDVRANWEEQRNEVHSWLSVRFGEVLEYEAKFVDHVVIDIAIKELQEAKRAIEP